MVEPMIEGQQNSRCLHEAIQLLHHLFRVMDEEVMIVTKFICGLIMPIDKELEIIEIHTLEVNYWKRKLVKLKNSWRKPSNVNGKF